MHFETEPLKNRILSIFNFFYLLSCGYFLYNGTTFFAITQLESRYHSKTYISTIILSWVIVAAIIFIAFFGYVALKRKSKPLISAVRILKSFLSLI